MTGPVPTEAQVEALAQYLAEENVRGTEWEAGFDWSLATDPTFRHSFANKAKRLLAGPLAPLLASLQQVTAERDEDRAEHARYRASAEEMWETAKRHGGQMLAEKRRADAAEAALATANAELDRLQAEVEAKDRARWRPIATAPTDRAVVVRMRTDRLQGGWFVATVTLPDPDDDSRFGSCSTIWHYNGDTLLTQFSGTWTEWLDDGGSDRTALVRAATAGEGRSDG